MRLKEVRDGEQGFVLYVIKKNDKNLNWAKRAALTFQWCEEQCYQHRLKTLVPQPPNPLTSPVLPISPSIAESHFPVKSVSLCIFLSPLSRSAAAESIEFQKHWVHPSRKYGAVQSLLRFGQRWCRGPALWEVIRESRDGRRRGLLVIQESGSESQGEKSWLMDISKLYLKDGAAACLHEC